MIPITEASPSKDSLTFEILTKIFFKFQEAIEAKLRKPEVIFGLGMIIKYRRY